MTWKPGESGNPRGKRTGTRDKITQAFLNKLDVAWRKNGDEAMERAAQEKPVEFCKLVASLLPKDQNLSVKNDNPVSDAFMAAMKVPIGLEDENARLKAEIAALKGETPENEPEAIADPVH